MLKSYRTAEASVILALSKLNHRVDLTNRNLLGDSINHEPGRSTTSLRDCFVLCLCSFCVYTGSASAACPDVSNAKPAMLVDNDKNREIVHNLLGKLPRSTASRIVIIESYVTESGKLSGAILIPRVFTRGRGDRTPGKVWQRRLDRVARKVRRLELEPAQLDSGPIRVYVVFSIIATRVEDRTATIIVMNRLQYVDHHGLYYSAPQRIASEFSRPRTDYMDTVFDVGVTVDEAGTATSVDYVEREGKRSRFMDDVIAELHRACFIPGQVDGLVQEMVYAERFTNSRPFAF